MNMVTGLGLWAFSVTTLVAADYSDPKKTVQTLAEAYHAADAKEIQNCYLTVNKEQARYLEAMAEVGAAYHRINKAAVRKFGKKADGFVDNGVVPKGPSKEELKRALEGIITMEGDKATLTMKGPSELIELIPVQATHFTRIGNDWKMNFEVPFPSGDPEKCKVWIGVFSDTSKKWNRIAADIDGGKFRNLQEASKALERTGID